MTRVFPFFIIFIVILCADGWGIWVWVVMGNHSVCVFKKEAGR